VLLEVYDGEPSFKRPMLRWFADNNLELTMYSSVYQLSLFFLKKNHYSSSDEPKNVKRFNSFDEFTEYLRSIGYKPLDKHQQETQYERHCVRVFRELIDTEKHFNSELQKYVNDTSMQQNFARAVQLTTVFVAASTRFLTSLEVTSLTLDVVCNVFDEHCNDATLVDALLQFMQWMRSKPMLDCDDHKLQMLRAYVCGRWPRYMLLLNDMQPPSIDTHSRAYHRTFASLSWLVERCNDAIGERWRDVVARRTTDIALALVTALPPYVVLEIVEHAPRQRLLSHREKIVRILNVARIVERKRNDSH
jgi:hypothetical protein